MRCGLCSVLLSAALVGCSPEPPQRAAPDILLLTVDTLRADRLGAWGHADARTPVIDALATQGVRFSEATTSLPRTTPALGSLMTGLAPHHHGAREVGDLVRHGARLAETLTAQGYVALGVSANAAAGTAQGLAQGFSVFEDRPGATAEHVTQRSLALIEDAPPEAPVLLWSHYVDPHFPYRAPGSDPESPCALRAAEMQSGRVSNAAVFADLDGRSALVLDDCRERYDEEIAYTDQQLGVLLAGLERAGRRHNAVIILTADHGENLGEDGLFFEHGPSLSDAAVRIPLIIAGPGIAAGSVRPDLVQLEDLAPTIHDLLALPAAARPTVDGRSLAPLLVPSAPPPDGESVVFHEGGSALQPGLLGWLHAGERRGRHCLHGEGMSWCEGGAAASALYDHRADPLLTAPVEDAQAQAVLQAAMQRWPAERTRRRAVRDAQWTLIARPQLSGGYTQTLYSRAGARASAENPEEAVRLAAALQAWAETVPADDAEARSAEQRAALQALGYIE